MITVHRADDRGRTRQGWLDSAHTFSFAEYYDPARMGYRSLRVINEDLVAPCSGFPTHAHRDMEILTWVLEGKLDHKDSLGHGSIVEPGEVQRMTAGTGIRHSEYNASRAEPLHLLQIWIQPERRGLAPEYAQRAFPESERRGRLRLVASHDGAEGSVTIHQDARVYAGLLESGERVHHPLGRGRHAWLQVTRGDVETNGDRLHAGDGAAIESEDSVEIAADGPAEVLLFDLA
jgi:hypothetical protein